MKVQTMSDIYWNSNKRLFSVRHKGKVTAHTTSAIVQAPKFVVSEAGRQRVLATRQKNVHAFVRGAVTCLGDTSFAQDNLGFYRENAAFSDYSFAVYDPYDECGCFRVLCVIGDILIRGEFADHIKTAHAYIYDGKPQIKVKMS